MNNIENGIERLDADTSTLKEDFSDLNNANSESIGLYNPDWETGSINDNGTDNDSATTYHRTSFIPVSVLNDMPVVNNHPTYSVYIYQYANTTVQSFLSYVQITPGKHIFTAGASTKYVRLVLGPSTFGLVEYYTYTTGYNYARQLRSDFETFKNGVETIVKTSPNILTRTNVQENAYISNTDGTIIDYNNWTTGLDYLPVTPGVTYAGVSFSGGVWTKAISAYCAFYNSSKEFTHGGVMHTGSDLTAQSGDAYLRVSVSNTYWQYLMIGVTSSITPYVGGTDVSAYQEPGNYVENDRLNNDVAELNARIDELTASPEIILPGSCVAVVGTQFNIYNENVVICDDYNKYDIFWAITPYTMTYQVMSDCLRFTPDATNVGNTYTITCAVKEKTTWKTIVSKTMSLSIIPNTALSGKTVVFIGDSLTNAGYYPYEIQHNLSNDGVVSVGTRLSHPEFNGEAVNIYHEGRGGWSPVDYISRASWGDDVNAFWNPTTNKFDFAYWMSNNNFALPDLIFINIGTNGAGNASANLTAINEIITSIRASSANVPILISLLTPPASQDGWDYVVPGGSAAQFAVQQITYNKACMEMFGNKENEHIYLSPVYFNLDRYHDYPTTEVAVSARNPELVTIQTNNIHPSKYGYFKFADVYWAMIQMLLT